MKYTTSHYLYSSANGFFASSHFNATIRAIALILIIFFTGCSGGGDGGKGGDVSNDEDFGSKPFNDTYNSILSLEPYDVSEESVDPITGQTVVRTGLTIMFAPGATRDQVDGLLNRLNATILAHASGSSSIGIRIPDPGTLTNLDSVIADIEKEPFIDFVLKSLVSEPLALPGNILEGYLDQYKITDNQLAVRGAAAWNAKNAIIAVPNILVVDFFGYGSTQLNTHLDATISGDISSGEYPDEEKRGHGYLVSGVISGSFDPANTDLTDAGRVTGIFPGHANFHIMDVLHLYGIDLAHPKGQRNLLEGQRDHFILEKVQEMGGTVVLNTSYGDPCNESLNGDACRSDEQVIRHARYWINLVRSQNLESHIFHPVPAGNRANTDNPNATRFDASDAKTKTPYGPAALRDDIIGFDGRLVDKLTNTLVVENIVGTSTYPRSVKCHSDMSYRGGNVGAVGTNVTSLSYVYGETDEKNGTSLSAPQVAGLAAYLLAINPSLLAQQIRTILLNTSKPVAVVNGDSDCSDWTDPASSIDAYAAILRLDNPEYSRNEGALVRRAILDVVNSANQEISDNVFDEHDIAFFLDRIVDGTQEFQNHRPIVKYSRADLNGDGYDGGTSEHVTRFNLDYAESPVVYENSVSQLIEGVTVNFNENLISDIDILCYYSYTNLYTGDITERSNLLAGRCEVNVVEVNSFESDTEGWQVVNYPFRSHYDSQTLVSAEFDSTGFGNPSASIRIGDVFAETGISSPGLSIGEPQDRSNWYGHSLIYDIFIRYSDNAIYPAVVLNGGDMSIYFDMQSPTINEWNTITVPLTQTGWKVSGEGRYVTPDEFDTILKNLQGLYIYTEWHTGPDDTNIDNFRVVEEIPEYVAKSLFGTSSESWSLVRFPFDTFSPAPDSSPVTFDDTMGNPMGSIQALDYYSETGVGAPYSFLGDKSTYYDGQLTYDIHLAIADAGATYPAVVLSDGAMSVYCEKPSSDFTVGDWTNVAIDLFVNSGNCDWKVSKASSADPDVFATEEQLRAVLSNMQGLYINAEWYTGISDNTHVDNVRLVF